MDFNNCNLKGNVVVYTEILIYYKLRCLKGIIYLMYGKCFVEG